MDTDRENRTVQCEAPKPTKDGAANRLDGQNIMGDSVNQLTDKQDPRTAYATEKFLVDITEDHDIGHNVSIVQDALRMTTHGIFMSMTDYVKVRKALQTATIQMFINSFTAEAIAKALVFVVKAMTPVTNFGTYQEIEDISEAAQQPKIVAPLSPPLSPKDLYFLGEYRNPHKAKNYLQREKMQFSFISEY